MEVIKRYPQIDDLISALTRIANNLDQLTEIMKKEKQIKNTLYGMSVARPLPDWDPEELRAEVQDLKLENDRLKKRDEIMTHFLRSVKCDLYTNDGCYWINNPSCKEMWNMIDSVFKKLEDL